MVGLRYSKSSSSFLGHPPTDADGARHVPTTGVMKQQKLFELPGTPSYRCGRGTPRPYEWGYETAKALRASWDTLLPMRTRHATSLRLGLRNSKSSSSFLGHPPTDADVARHIPTTGVTKQQKLFELHRTLHKNNNESD